MVGIPPPLFNRVARCTFWRDHPIANRKATGFIGRNATSGPTIGSLNRFRSELIMKVKNFIFKKTQRAKEIVKV